MKPLAIDLSKPELLDAANVAIKKLVACWAQNPNHMPLRIGDDLPCPVSFEVGLMSNFKNAGFAARFTCARQVWAASSESRQHRVTVRTTQIICFLLFWISLMKRAAEIASRLPRAFIRAIASIGSGWDYLEMGAAAAAGCSAFRNVRLLATSAPSDALGALVRAIEFVRPDSRETFAAIFAGQIIHA